MTAAIAAKKGRSCPSTADARNHAKLAATAVCAMGKAPVCNRPSVSPNWLRNAKIFPSKFTLVSTPKPMAEHLPSKAAPPGNFTARRVYNVPLRQLCATNTQCEVITAVRPIKAFNGPFNELLPDCC
jgi:hypothetical protein